MDGYEVARRIRQHHGLRNVLLVAQTGWGGDVDRERSSAAGFDAHLVKPVTPTTLEEVIRAMPR
jgi:two-component system CheB/CheR fusion protein